MSLNLNRISPDRVLAAALKVDDVVIVGSCWITVERGRKYCCGLGLVAIAEGKVSISNDETLSEIRAIKLEEVLGLDSRYRRGFDLGFGGYPLLTFERQNEFLDVGREDGRQAREVLLSNLDVHRFDRGFDERESSHD